MAEPKFPVNTPQEREVFRTFAALHPDEAAEQNWPEFVAMAKEVNPNITEEVLLNMLTEEP